MTFTQDEDINQGFAIGNNAFCIDESSDTETSARVPSCFDLVTREKRSSLNVTTAPTSKIHGSNSGKDFACLKATSIYQDKNTLALEPIVSDDFAIAATTGPLAKDPLPTVASTLPEVSTYNTRAIIVNARRKAALALGNHTKRMLVRAPLDKVLLLKPKLESLYIELSNFAVDFSTLKGRIETYLQGIIQYINVWAEYAHAITSETQSLHLAFVGK